MRQPSRSLTQRKRFPPSSQFISGSVKIDPGVVLFGKDRAALPGLGIRDQNLQRVLQPVEMLQIDLVRVSSNRPRRYNCSAGRRAFSSQRRSPPPALIDADADRRVLRARFRIRNLGQGRIKVLPCCSAKENPRFPTRRTAKRRSTWLSGLHRQQSRRSNSSSLTQSDVPLISVCEPSLVSA